MTYVYIAHAPEDQPFAARLSQDLKQSGIAHWYDAGANDVEAYQQLQKSTHVAVLLSPASLAAERVLAALEFAKQNQRERVVLRLAPMAILPPQMTGILPIDVSSDESYTSGLETLLDDLLIQVTEVKPALPANIIEMVYQDDPQVRRAGIQKLAALKADPDLKELVREELQALVFREKDGSLKQLLHLTLQGFDLEGQPLPPAPTLPSKEELAEQAKAHAVWVDDPIPVTAPLKPPSKTVYLWQSPRWQIVWLGVSLLLGLIPALAGGNLVYALPVLAVGVLLPPLNTALRGNGAYIWPTGASVLWNVILGTLIGGLTGALLLLAVIDLTGDYLGWSAALGVMLALVIGWLASFDFEVPA